MKQLVILLSLILATWASVPQAQDTRFFYVTPVDGAGTDADPYRSRCLNLPGKGNIDLRPWGINRFLCASNSLPADMTGVQQLGASFIENLTAPRKAALEALIGKTLTATTVDQAIVELLLPRLNAGRDGKLKIFLGRGAPIYQQTAGIPFQDGGLVADLKNYAQDLLEPAIAWALTSTTESWNCADDLTGGTNSVSCDRTWVNITNWLNIDRVSNRLTGTGNFVISTYVDVPMDTINQTASLTIVDVAIGGGTLASACPAVRQPGTATLTFYRACASRLSSGETNGFLLIQTIAGVNTTLDSDTQDWVANDVVTVSADGTSIIGKVNGVELMTATDSGITTGNYGAIRLAGDNATSTWTVDTFSLADITSTRNRGPMWFN